MHGTFEPAVAEPAGSPSTSTEPAAERDLEWLKSLGIAGAAIGLVVWGVPKVAEPPADGQTLSSLRVGLVASLAMSVLLAILQVFHEFATANIQPGPSYGNNLLSAMWTKCRDFILDVGLVMFTSAGSAFFGAGLVTDTDIFASRHLPFVFAWFVTIAVVGGGGDLVLFRFRGKTTGSSKVTLTRILSIVVGAVYCGWVAAGASR